MTKIIETSLVNKMMKDKLVRTSITKDSFLYFFHFYYAHYVKYETADFQKEIIHHLEKSATENLYVVAFRGSGKSTMVTTAYPIWGDPRQTAKEVLYDFLSNQNPSETAHDEY